MSEVISILNHKSTVRARAAFSVRALSIFVLALFALSLLLGIPSLTLPRYSSSSSPSQLVNLVVDPRPPILVADNATYAALVLQFVNESSNLPAVPTKSVTIYLSSSNLQVGNVSTSVIFPAGQIFYIADFTTTYFAGSTKITALANSSMPSIPGTATVTTSAAAGAPMGFQLFTNPSIIPAVSGFTSSITVEAVDSENNPAEVSQPVSVALSSSNLTVGSVPISVTIPAGASFASTNFTATNTYGSSIISASSSGLVPAETTMATFASANKPTALSVQVAPPELIANGETYTNVISISLLDSNGNPAIAASNIVVNLNVSGTALSAGNVVSSKVTILNGTFSAYLSFQTTKISGTTEIFASSPNFVSGQSNLTTVAPPAVTLQLYTIPTGVLAGGGTFQDLIAVQLQEADGAPSQAVGNVFVELGTEDSAVGSVSPSVTIPSGSNFAFVNLTTTSQTGAINITAIASGYLSAEATVSSVFLPASVSISESAINIPTTSTSLVTITATSEGAALTDASVTWTVVGGSLLGTFSGASNSTNASGMASATFNPGSTIGAISIIVSVSKPDYLPNNASASLDVYSQQVYAVLTAKPAATPVLNSSTLSLVVTSSGTPLVNASVQWSSSAGGSIVDPSFFTNSTGMASAIFQAGANASTVQIQAKISKSGYFTYLANMTDQVFVPTFSVQNYAPESVLGGANSSVSVEVDSIGVVVRNASVSWRIVSGPLSHLVGTSSTNSSGYSHATFAANDSAGVGYIQAVISKSGLPTYTDDIEITVNLLNMTVQVVEPNPSIVENYTSAFAIHVTSSGSPVSFANVSWSAVGGTLTTSSPQTNGTGYAKAVFVAGYQAGNMSVKAVISKAGYFNYSEYVYIVVVKPDLSGSTGVSAPSKDFLLIKVGDLIPVWALIVVAGIVAGGFFFMRRRGRSSDGYYEEE